MVSFLSRSGSYIIMWLQCFAPLSSAARGRRQDRRPLAHRVSTLPSLNMPERTLWADVLGCASDKTAHIMQYKPWIRGGPPIRRRNNSVFDTLPQQHHKSEKVASLA